MSIKHAIAAIAYWGLIQTDRFLSACRVGSRIQVTAQPQWPSLALEHVDQAAGVDGAPRELDCHDVVVPGEGFPVSTARHSNSCPD